MKKKPGVVLAAAMLLSMPAAAEIVIPHMGRIAIDDELVTGYLALRFGLYTRELDPSGESSLVWEETYDVSVHEGVYRVDLGATTGGKAPLTVADFQDRGHLWLEISIIDQSYPEGVRLNPRMRLAASALAHSALDSARLGGRPADAYLLKTDFDEFRDELTGGGEGGLSIPWSRLTGVPAGFADEVDDGLTEVHTSGALAGKGTVAEPLTIAPGGVNGAMLAPASVGLDRLARPAANCPEGHVLKASSEGWTCGVDAGSAGSLTFNVAPPLDQIPGDVVTLVVTDKGIEGAKLADAAVTAAKLANDAGGLAKVTGGAASVANGSVGIGVANPARRLDVSWASAVNGTGSVDVAANSQTATLKGGTTTQLQIGDLVTFGQGGERYVTGINNSTQFTFSAPPLSTTTNNNNMTFTVRRTAARIVGGLQADDAFVGHVGHDNWAGFAHTNAVGTRSYALRQSSDGRTTILNKASGGGAIGFRIDDVDRMVITDAGNVGIGTSSPTAKLEVAGHFTTTACGAGQVKVVNGLCMDSTWRDSASMPDAVSACIGLGGRVCTYGDFTAACKRNIAGASPADIYGRWIGNVVSDDTVLYGNSTGSSCDNFEGHSAKTASRGYKCCYGPAGGGY